MSEETSSSISMARTVSTPPSVELVDGPTGTPYSHRILELARDNPLLVLKRTKDGAISEHDVAVMATTILSAADERIRSLEARNALLERRNSVINGPMFLPAPSKSVDPKAPPLESNWFLQYLTLRNFLSALIVIVGALWGFFTWYSADKGVQLSDALAKAAASDRSADQAVKEREQFQKDSEYWKKNSTDYQKNAEKKEQERAKAAEDAASEKTRADTLSQQLLLSQKQSKELLEKLTAPALPPKPAAPAVSPQPTAK
jgi:hypothetical protein